MPSSCSRIDSSPDTLITLPGAARDAPLCAPPLCPLAGSNWGCTARGRGANPAGFTAPLRQTWPTWRPLLFEANPSQKIPITGQLSLIETRTPVDEVREALRWVKARIIRDGVHPGECAIVNPNPEAYRQILREIAAEFRLPLRFTHGELLHQRPRHGRPARPARAAPAGLARAADGRCAAGAVF